MTKTTEEKISVMQAFVDGKDIEVRSDAFASEWGKTDYPSWDWKNYEYRIAEEPRTPDTLDWSHADERLICHAVDENEFGWFFSSTPGRDEGEWYCKKGIDASSACLSSFKRGNLPWDQSLIYRPGYEPKEDGE